MTKSAYDNHSVATSFSRYSPNQKLVNTIADVIISQKSHSVCVPGFSGRFSPLLAPMSRVTSINPSQNTAEQGKLLLHRTHLAFFSSKNDYSRRLTQILDDFNLQGSDLIRATKAWEYQAQAANRIWSSFQTADSSSMQTVKYFQCALGELAWQEVGKSPVVFAIDVFPHIRDLTVAMEQIFSMLSPGGNALITFFPVSGDEENLSASDFFHARLTPLGVPISVIEPDPGVLLPSRAKNWFEIKGDIVDDELMNELWLDLDEFCLQTPDQMAVAASKAGLKVSHVVSVPGGMLPVLRFAMILER